MTFIEKPSQLPQAIGAVLHAAFPDIKVGSHQDFQGDAERCRSLPQFTPARNNA